MPCITPTQCRHASYLPMTLLSHPSFAPSSPSLLISPCPFSPTPQTLLAFSTGQSIIIGSVVDIQANREMTFAAIKLNDSRGESVILLVTGCLKRILSAVPHIGSIHCENSFARSTGTGAGAGIVALVFQAHLLLESDPLISMKGPKIGPWICNSQCLSVFYQCR